jgi:hypothetical protein
MKKNAMRNSEREKEDRPPLGTDQTDEIIINKSIDPFLVTKANSIMRDATALSTL